MTGRWALAFFSLIPLFGLIYFALPAGSFRSETIRFERSMADDQMALQALLTGEIRQRTDPRPFVYDDEEVHVVTDGVTATLLEVMDGRLIIHTKVSVMRPSGDTRGLGLSVEADHLGHKFFTTSGNDVYVGVAVYRTNHLGIRGPDVSGVPIETVYPLVDSPEEIPSADGRLFLSSDVFDEAMDYLAAYGGEPRLASGYLARSVYFSVVTVTTLGFGDIAPISSPARLLVGLESVLGVLFVGLFLNSLRD